MRAPSFEDVIAGTAADGAAGEPRPGGDEVLAISSLLPADSPRLAGEDKQHVRLLAASDLEFPPILVHRESMRVIDGMHRLRAAVLRGQDTIKVRYFDGSQDVAFVLAVESNIKHGLPLSLADREAAAARILAAQSEWSDRAIAMVTGLSAKTVAGIRQGATADLPRLHSRIGRDGKRRPVSGEEGRRRASELIAERPDASLREIARHAGISPGTARDVRERLRRGENPVPQRQRVNGQRVPNPPEQRLRRGVAARRVSKSRDRATILHNLRRDPSIRFTESGRNLLQWLHARAVGVAGWQAVVASVPPHCAYAIADLACATAEEWLEMAAQLRQRAESLEHDAAGDAVR